MGKSVESMQKHCQELDTQNYNKCDDEQTTNRFQRDVTFQNQHLKMFEKVFVAQILNVKKIFASFQNIVFFFLKRWLYLWIRTIISNIIWPPKRPFQMQHFSVELHQKNRQHKKGIDHEKFEQKFVSQTQ